MCWPSRAPLRGAGADQPGSVGGVASVDGDPRLGAALVAGHVLDLGPAQRGTAAQHAGCERADLAMPPVEDYATGPGAGSVGHAKVSFAFREIGVESGWPGRGMAVPQARHLLCQVTVSALTMAYASADTPW